MIKEVKLGSICDIYSAGDKPKNFSEIETKELSIPVYGNGREFEGLVGFTDKAGVLSKAVTVAARGSSCGVAFYRTKPYMPIVRLISLVAKPGIDTKYLYYQVCNRHFKGSGSGQPQITIPDIADAPIYLETELKLQEKISEVLFTLDEKIANNTAICLDFENMAKIIYDYWFVQFDFPDENGKPYKSSGGKMVWNKELKREIPEGWEAVPLGEILSFEKGKIPNILSDSSDDEHDSAYVTIDVANNGKPQYCNKTGMTPCNGETIMVMDGAASGDVYIGFEGSLGSTFSKLPSKREDVSDTLILMILKSNMPIYKRANTGSTVPHANRSFIEKMIVAIPQNADVYSKKFDLLYKSIIEYRKENQQLASLRDFLLPMLMNGQVKVG